MQIKTVDALEALRAIQTLSERKVPFRSALVVRRMMRELSAIQEDFQAERTKLIEQYAKRDEKGTLIATENRYHFENGQRELFEADYAELVRTPVEVNTRLVASDLEGIEIEPSVLFAMGDLLLDPDAADTPNGKGGVRQ